MTDTVNIRSPHPPFSPQKCFFSYLWADLYEWFLLKFEMTDTVQILIIHIFRAPLPPSLQNTSLVPKSHSGSIVHTVLVLIYGPILIRFGTNGPCLNGKWLTLSIMIIHIFMPPVFPSPQNTLLVYTTTRVALRYHGAYRYCFFNHTVHPEIVSPSGPSCWNFDPQSI